MALLTEMRERVRLQLGDRSTPFRDTFRGSGDVAEFALSHINLSLDSLRVTAIAPEATSVLIRGTDYDVDVAEGLLTFDAPVPDGTVLLVEGESYGMLSDEEIDTFLDEALIQHINDRTITQRHRSETGHIRYHNVPVGLANLPEVEEHLLVLLTTIQALWALSTDAATDIDVAAPDGTQIPRGQRYAQLLKQIDVLTEKYRELCAQLNVGLSRIEMSTLRRVSRTTGRYVPVFQAKEYDDHSRSQRLLPEIDGADKDDSGVPSPAFYNGHGGY